MNQKDYERDLRDEEAFVESILDAIPDSLYAFDEEGTMLRWNEQLSTLTGYSNAEIAEMDPSEFIAEEYVDELQQASTPLAARPQPWEPHHKPIRERRVTRERVGFDPLQHQGIVSPLPANRLLLALENDLQEGHYS